MTIQDVEFIICDNASTDHTQAVVTGYVDPRIRYLRSDKRLSMPENFERGLQAATGEYVLTMGDDDFIIEENLALALDQADKTKCDLMYWFRGCFYWGNYPDDSLSATFLIPVGRGHYPVESFTLLNTAYLGLVGYQYLPSVYNSLCRRSFLKRYHDYLRGLYFPDYVVSVDVFSALVFCALSPVVLFQQSPVVVSGISYHSNGMSTFNGGKEISQFKKELGRSENGYLVPEEFIDSVIPITTAGVNELGLLVDYFNVINRLLHYTHTSVPCLDTFAKLQICRLLSGGHIQVDKASEFYSKLILGNESAPIVQEDLATYFFKFWSIPIPQAYTGEFESNLVTVRHLSAHLVSIGFNAVSPT
jgi:glycosyltransferase involved in cell wall biosynthesis